MNPEPGLLGVIRESMKAVPAVRYALGVASVAAAVAVVLSFSVSYKVAVFGTVIMFVLMFMLVLFVSFVGTPNSSLKFLSFMLAGAFTLLIIGTAFFMFTGFFFSWPRPLEEVADRVTGSHAASATPAPPPSPAPTSSPTPAVQPSPTPAATQTPFSPSPTPAQRGQVQRAPAAKRTPDYVGRAHSLYDQGKYEEAIRECDKALRLNPRDGEAASLKRHIARTLGILNRQ